MTGDKLTVYEQELLWALMHLVSISSNFLLFIPLIIVCIAAGGSIRSSRQPLDIESEYEIL